MRFVSYSQRQFWRAPIEALNVHMASSDYRGYSQDLAEQYPMPLDQTISLNPTGNQSEWSSFATDPDTEWLYNSVLFDPVIQTNPMDGGSNTGVMRTTTSYGQSTIPLFDTNSSQ